MLSKWQTFAFFTALGLLHFFYKYLEDAAAGRFPPWNAHFICEMTASYGSFVLLPIVLWVCNRFRPDRIPLLRWLAPHMATMLVYSVVKTSLNWISRLALFPMAGLGPYNYGVMPIRYLMELPGDVIGYSMICGVYLFLRRDLESRELEKALAKAKLEKLNLQLQPHFLFNAMNAISATVYEDAAKADLMLSRLAGYLRRTLALSDSQEVTLDQELELLQLYAGVMKARFEDGLLIAIDVDPSTRGMMVPQLLLQPIVENAIRHGGAGRVDVKVSREGSKLRMSIRNEGFVEAPRGLGIGLKNTEERLTALYGAAGAMRIEKLDRGTEVCLELPCRDR